MQHIKQFTFLVLIFTCTYTYSQVSITGEIRPRSEFRYGYRTLRSETSEASFFTSQRSRINLNYTSEKYTAFISVQDVRIWGDEKLSLDVPSLALNEAWIRYKVYKNLNLKFGRQSYTYDNNRIISAANWLQNAKKHDAVLINYAFKKWDIDFMNAFNQTNESLSGTYYDLELNYYKYLSMFCLSKSGKKMSVQTLLLLDGYQHSIDTVFTRLTYGTTLEINLKKLFFDARIYKQQGKMPSGIACSSFLINLDFTTKFVSTNVILGLDISSGDDYKKLDGKSHTFETPYGAKHWFNGTMDYFKKSADTKNTGLLDYYSKIEHKISLKTSMLIHYHCFTSFQKYYNEQSKKEAKRYLASELDFCLRSKIAREVGFEFGYSILKGSSTLALMKTGNVEKLNHWMYVMLTFKPQFI